IRHEASKEFCRNLMLKTRIIPALLLRNDSLVKTVKFDKTQYIGDPVNTVRIFNELEVDELLFLDILASIEGRKPNISILEEIADECFMPVAYGGGVTNFEDAKQVLTIGFEKISLNTAAFDKQLVTQIAEHFGNQSVIASIDVKKSFWGKYEVYSHGGRKNRKLDPVAWAQELESLGAGEILLTSIDKEGTWSGFDLQIIRQVTDAVSIPVIAHGGAGGLQHIEEAV